MQKLLFYHGIYKYKDKYFTFQVLPPPLKKNNNDAKEYQMIFMGFWKRALGTVAKDLAK